MAARRPRRLRDLLRDTRGTATIETAIMIPVFILIWGAILYMAQGFEAAIDNASVDRQHAWQHAMDGCRSRAPAGTTFRDATDPPGGDLVGEVEGIIDRAIRLLPAIGDHWPGLELKEVEATRRDRVVKPFVLGEGQGEVRHRVVLMCNERRKGDGALDDLTWAAWLMFGW